MSAINSIAAAARGVVTPRKEGHRLIVGDLAQMEARIAVWLAGEEEVLQGFRDGIDMYCKDASSIYGHEVIPAMKQKRFVGKVSRLSNQYQGGIGAGVRMCDSYGVDITPVYPELWAGASIEEREAAIQSYAMYCDKVEEPYEPVNREAGYALDIIKQRFRQTNPKLVEFWKTVEQAAIFAVESGKVVDLDLPYCNMHMFTHKEFFYIRLPDGKDILYPFPKVDSPKSGRGKSTLSYRYVNDRNQWVRGSTYGGKLVENIVQAIQRQLLVQAMKRVTESGYEIVLHVHDEIVAEVPNNFGSVDDFRALMRDSESWSEGLPVNAHVWEGWRYGKD